MDSVTDRDRAAERQRGGSGRGLTLVDYLMPSTRRAPKRNRIKRREKGGGEQDTKKGRKVIQDARVNVDATCLGETELPAGSRRATKSRGLWAPPVSAIGSGVGQFVVDLLDY